VEGEKSISYGGNMTGKEEKRIGIVKKERGKTEGKFKMIRKHKF
jgi:hypothetical protein